MKIGCIFLFLLFFFAGCAAEVPSPFTGTPRRRTNEAVAVYAEQAPPGPLPFAVLFPAPGTVPAMHEPGEGVLLGAWLEPNSHLTPRCFAEHMQKEHAIFAYELTLGDELPFMFIIHALAAGAAPLFYLHPMPDMYNEIPVEALVELARALGEYNEPMFLAFFPLEQTQCMAAGTFISTFRVARIIFRVYAPQVAFVWVPPGGDAFATPSHPFYPGHDAVDWVGIGALTLRTYDSEPVCPTEILTPFHHNFARYKPIMLLPLGISHFSRARYVYYIDEKIQEIAYVFGALPGFPRVKAVVYREALRFGPNRDALALTWECELIAAYTRAVAGPYFLSTIASSPGIADFPTIAEFPTIANSSHTMQWQRAALRGYYYENAFFIDIHTLVAELQINYHGANTEINGRFFADASRLNIPLTACHASRTLRVHLHN